jgi:spore maturation protein A
MLNYIWAGLIISSFVFAVGNDARDLARDRYRNGQPLPVELAFPQGYQAGARQQPVQIRISPADYTQHYGTDEKPQDVYAGTLVQTQAGQQVRFAKDASLPPTLASVAKVSKSNEDELQGALVGFTPPSAPAPVAPPPAVDTLRRDSASVAAVAAPAPPSARASVRFEPVRFVKLNAIAGAALDTAETAATLALSLVGTLALFLGMLKIAEAAGVVDALVRFVRPLIGPLFPELPPDHPALGMIALNFTANMFGLGNAATPFGIKAMEEMQKLNPTEDTATNSMVMLLAINTASVQLVPPVLLLGILGLQMNQLIFPIISSTLLGLVVAITSVKLYGKLPSVRASDPMRNAAAATRPDAGRPGGSV